MLQYNHNYIHSFQGEKLVSVPLQDVHKVFGSTVDCRGMGICTKDEEGAFFTVVLMSEREGLFGKKVRVNHRIAVTGTDSISLEVFCL